MSRDFFCDARNVGAQAASLERAARGEAVRRPDSKDVALRGLGLRPLLDEGDHFVWDRGIDQTAPRLGSTESSTSPDEAEDDETGTLREESITPSRAAAVDASRGLTFLRRSKVRASTQHAVDSRVADFLQWSEERETLRDVPWALLGAVFREESWSWLAMRRRHRRQPTTTCRSGVRPPQRERTGLHRGGMQEDADVRVPTSSGHSKWVRQRRLAT